MLSCQETATITVRQVQVDKGISTFDFALEVDILDQEGNRHSQTQELHGENAARGVTFTFQNISKKPKAFYIDPRNKLFFKLDISAGEDTLAGTLETATDVRSRINAGTTLASFGTLSSLKKLRKAIASEKFYGVRVHVVKELMRTNFLPAFELASEMLLQEPDYMALSPMIASIGKIRDPKVLTAIASRWFIQSLRCIRLCMIT